MHQRLDRPVFGHRDRNSQGLEAGLHHPRGQHGAGHIALLGRDDIQAAAQAAQGLIQIGIQGLHLLDGLFNHQCLAQVRARFFAELVSESLGLGTNPNYVKGRLQTQIPEAVEQGIARLVLATARLKHTNPLLVVGHGQDGADRRFAFPLGRRSQNQRHRSLHQLPQLLRISRFQIHHFHRHAGFGDPLGDRLGQPIAVAIVGHIEHGGSGFRFGLGLAPVAIATGEFNHVVAQQGAVAGGDRVVAGEGIHPLHGSQDRSSIRGHQAFVIEPKIWLDRPQIRIKQVIAAIVHPKGIAGVEGLRPVVIGKDCVWPMEIGRIQKLQHMPLAQIQALAAFHQQFAEGLVNQIFQKLNRHLGSHHGDIRIQGQQIRHQAAVIRFRVAHHQVINLGRVDRALQGIQIELAKFGVGGVHQGHFVPTNQEGVIGCAVLQAKFNIKAIAIPVQRSNRQGLGGNLGGLNRQPLLGLRTFCGDNHARTSWA